MDDEKSDRRDFENIDRAELNLPEGRLSISGASAGKIFVFIGFSMIILALGMAISNILDAWGN